MNELQELRKSAGLTQRQVAERVGLNVHTYGSYERGDRVPDYKTMDWIREELGAAGYRFPDGVENVTVEPAVAGRTPQHDTPAPMSRVLDWRLLSGSSVAQIDEPRFVQVCGSGLSPVLRDGQTVIVDPSHPVASDGFYVWHCSESSSLHVAFLSSTLRGVRLQMLQGGEGGELLRHVGEDRYVAGDGQESTITLVGRVAGVLSDPRNWLNSQEDVRERVESPPPVVA